MSAEHNAALVRRYFEECVDRVNGPHGEQALAVLDELLSPDFAMAYNNDSDPEVMRGLDRHRDFLLDHARWYQDDTWTVEAVVADEATVACRWRIVARHARRAAPIDVRAADFFTVRDGRLAELRRFLDFKSLDDQVRVNEVR